MLSNSITERAVNIIKENPSIDPIEAVGQAIREENELLKELLENKTSRAIESRETLCKNLYGIYISKH